MAFLLGLEEPGEIFLFIFMVVRTLSMEPPSHQSAECVACVVTHRHGADQHTLGLTQAQQEHNTVEQDPHVPSPGP